MELVMAEGNMIKGRCSRIGIRLEKLIKTLEIAGFSDFIPIFFVVNFVPETPDGKKLKRGGGRIGINGWCGCSGRKMSEQEKYLAKCRFQDILLQLCQVFLGSGKAVSGVLF